MAVSPPLSYTLILYEIIPFLYISKQLTSLEVKCFGDVHTVKGDEKESGDVEIKMCKTLVTKSNFPNHSSKKIH